MSDYNPAPDRRIVEAAVIAAMDHDFANRPSNWQRVSNEQVRRLLAGAAEIMCRPAYNRGYRAGEIDGGADERERVIALLRHWASQFVGSGLASDIATLRWAAERIEALSDPESDTQLPPCWEIPAESGEPASGPHSAARLQTWIDEEGLQAVADELERLERDCNDVQARECDMTDAYYRQLDRAEVAEAKLDAVVQAVENCADRNGITAVRAALDGET